MRRIFAAGFFAILLLSLPGNLFSSLPELESDMILDEQRLEGLVHAPDFPEHLEWLNTARPLSMKDLQGKVVLIDFWTFCCINCMHIIPDLKKLEAKYGDALSVIGVHSAKFTNEKGIESIRQAVLRYGIRHPVLNDKDFEVWESYAANAWPTLVLINPNGKVIGVHSGEGVYPLFDPLIEQTIKHFDAKHQIDRTPLNLVLEESAKPASLLSFPGKISADPASGKLFISDTNHHRILIADKKGNVLDVIGSAHEGARDGSFEEAEFNQPQGTALKGDILYIADTENHLIRAADLKKRTVKTILGTGVQSSQLFQSLQGIDDLPLNSPWDLTIHEDDLYIAMAGAHQIWKMNLKTRTPEIWAGSGKEALMDGPLLESSLAQPSGISVTGGQLYFADSEVSAVRRADLASDGRVETLAGEDLFVFGDVDGEWARARLQHPLGVYAAGDQLFVADTYNSKIKWIDLKKKTIQTFAGTGRHGDTDGERLQASFFEPGGLTLLDQKLYVADTNNHRIRTLDLKSGKVSTFHLKDLEKVSHQTSRHFPGREIKLPEVGLSAGDATMELFIDLPQGYKFTANAPFYFEWESEDDQVVKIGPEHQKLSPGSVSLPIRFPLTAAKGFTALRVQAVIYYCREDSTLCLFENLRAELPVRVSEDTQKSKFEVRLPVLIKKGLKR